MSASAWATRSLGASSSAARRVSRPPSRSPRTTDPPSRNVAAAADRPRPGPTPEMMTTLSSMRPIRYAPVMPLGDGAPESMYVDFDPFSLEYTQQTACVINRRLRSHLPAYSTHYGGFWPLSRHADVME